MRISGDRIALKHELEALVIDYWHDVDTNWGRNAPQYYTPDGEFIGPAATYKGRDKIRQFYKWREDRGTRTVVHAVVNFQVLPKGEDRATCHWFLMLYAADGSPPLPTHPPIQIAYMTDRMLLDRDEGWLVESRTFENWFEGGTPATNPTLDDD